MNYRTPNRKRFQRTALLAVLWAAIALSLFAVREILLPFFLAVFLAYIIEPILRKVCALEFGGKTIPRWMSIIGLYLLIFALVWAFVVFFVPRLYTEVARLASTTGNMIQSLEPDAVENAADRVNELLRKVRLPVRVNAEGTPAPASNVENLPRLAEAARVASQSSQTSAKTSIPTDDVLYVIPLGDVAKAAGQQILSGLQERTGSIAVQVQQVVGGTLNSIFKFFLVLMLTAFLAVDTERVKRYLFTIVPIEDRDRFDELLSRIDTGLSGVVRGQLTICLVNGVLTLVGLLLFGVKFAFILATVATVFSLVPIFGSIASTIPIVVVALATSGIGTALIVLLWILGIHAVEANLLNPKIMGDAARIHPFLVVLALISGEHFYGIAGALFAVPCLSIGLTIFKFVHARALSIEASLGTPERGFRGQDIDRQKSGRVSNQRPPRIWREPRS